MLETCVTDFPFKMFHIIKKIINILSFLVKNFKNVTILFREFPMLHLCSEQWHDRGEHYMKSSAQEFMLECLQKYKHMVTCTNGLLAKLANWEWIRGEN